ncbi:class I SAM-dependent methyltransferase [Pleomorphomonas sp. NRK KF1]|uniref:class I SAM-dependent methyltransferase n=1 Tax=Pleomorphomonas sp. NRK KF1 TaxID=2943000 RepID=UPI002044B292|nr:class I SAM-dependent methyltransferase [Pleomorphomonas sp. NRK KF1]MCM5554522.1 hypothetical protein [Pleomorphomonas sp. NRK KF1]
MRYNLYDGVEIRTENAAKPASQPSKYLLSIMSNLENVESSFDYGCGKLRYSEHILKSTSILTVVDSECQLSREQYLFGRKTSIRSLYERANVVDVYNQEEFDLVERKYDRGFCINVLSAVPSYEWRWKIVKSIHRKLATGGEVLFVVQYRNSDFSRMMRMENTRPWLDGFIIDSRRGYSFYGLLPPQRLHRFLLRAGFHVTDFKLNEGSAYMWATAR